MGWEGTGGRWDRDVVENGNEVGNLGNADGGGGGRGGKACVYTHTYIYKYTHLRRWSVDAKEEQSARVKGGKLTEARAWMERGNEHGVEEDGSVACAVSPKGTDRLSSRPVLCAPVSACTWPTYVLR